MAARVPPIDRERSAARIERDIETLSGREYTLSDEAIRRYAYTPEYRQHARLLRRASSRRSASTSPRTRSARSSRATGRRRARVRDRLALRLEPERRQLRRHDGRRHGARGLPAERGARARPAAAADLVPRGGGLRLRADAARQPDHAAARDRGGPARAVPRDRRRAQLLGARRGGRLRAGALARVDPRARRPHRLDRDAHRAGARAPGHRQPDRRSSTRSPATCTPTSIVHGRGDHAGATPMDLRLDPTLVLAETVLELERLARAGGAAARSARSARSRSTRG